MKHARNNEGLALLTIMLLIGFIGTLFGAYVVVTQTELALVKSSRDSQSGFNAAEAGLNIRAEAIREKFIDFSKPSGTSPTSVLDCDAGGSGAGSGDYACETFEFGNNHSAVTYVQEDPNNPIMTVIPPGETFAGLSAIEERYMVTSVGRNSAQSNEAILDLTFQSRRVPLFQFMIFFEEDLEFFNGAVMTVDGPVHTNGDFYIGTQTDGQTNYTGLVNIAGTLYRGQKSIPTCTGYTGTARVSDTPDTDNPNLVTLPACSSNRFEIDDVDDWNGRLNIDLDPVTVPAPSEMDSFSNGEYWQRADLRLVLRLNGSGNPIRTNAATAVEVVNTDGTINVSATNSLHHTSCTGQISEGARTYAVGTRGSSNGSGNRLRLYREYQLYPGTNNYQRTLEIDMINLLNCIQRFPAILGGKLLSDDTEDGLVFFAAVDGPLSSASQNNYSVRIRNGSVLHSTLSGAAETEGLTVVSDQGLVIWGDYNSNNSYWVPAALMADTLWLLSNDWVDGDSEISDAYTRDGSATTVNAAVISGIRRTGNANGEAGQDHGEDSNGFPL